MTATTAAVAISCTGVTKTYGTGQSRVTALRGIDLDVREGELLMLVGPSGCGKTTLISVIAGILDHDDGECLVFGENLKAMPQSRRTRFRGDRIGFVFQQFNLIPTLTNAENVAVPLLIQGKPRGTAIAQARALLDEVGIGDRWRDLPGKLSGGQQQRVAIARSLVHDPRLIVCDEPTSSLDHETGQKVMELMKRVATGRDRALVVVTHDARIFGFADRIARMDDGKILSVSENGQPPNGH